MNAGTGYVCLSISTIQSMFDIITKKLQIKPSKTYCPKIGGFVWEYEIMAEHIYATSQLEQTLMKTFEEKENYINDIAQNYDAKINIEFVLYHPSVKIGIIFSREFIRFSEKCNATISVDQYLWE